MTETTTKNKIEFGYKFMEDQKELIFYVTDTGVGFPPEKKEIIFERFTQADHSASRKYGGSGLGITLAKQFVELMGGEMGVESEVSKGSNFWFIIPFQLSTKKEQNKLCNNIKLVNTRDKN